MSSGNDTGRQPYNFFRKAVMHDALTFTGRNCWFFSGMHSVSDIVLSLQDDLEKLLEVQRSLIGSFEVIQPGRVRLNGWSVIVSDS